jgi:hypothetical protein
LTALRFTLLAPRSTLFEDMWRFWLIHLLLLLLYGWTWTEETPITVRVGEDGVCQAIAPDRSLAIECPNLAGGRVGLFNVAREPLTVEDAALLDWLAPPSAWAEVEVVDPAGEVVWSEPFSRGELAGWEPLLGEWQVIGGELRAKAGSAALLYQERLDEGVTIHASLRRGREAAGILLLEANGEDGWLFLLSGQNRNGVWWRWEGGEPAEPLIGMPYQKPFLAQLQSFLRGPLRAQQGGLLLIAVGYVLRIAYSVLRIKKGELALAARAGTQGNSKELKIRNREYGIGDRNYLLVGLLLITFAFTTWVARDLLEGVPHVQDSLTYLFQAKTMARGALWAPAPPLPEFFEQEFLLVRDGRWFGKYPPGYPAVLAIGVWLGVPWLVNPLLATLTMALLYRLGRMLYGRRVGLLAAGLGVTSPFFLFMAGDQMAHSAELFWITLFMVLWLKGLHGGWRWVVTAGVALGMAFLTRQLAALAVGLPFALVTWYFHDVRGSCILRCNRPASEDTGLLKWGGKAASLFWLGAACLPFVMGLFVYQGVMTGDPWLDPRSLFWEYDRVGFGPALGEPSNMLQVSMTADEQPVLTWLFDPSQPPRGHSLARGVYNVERLWLALERHLFGWPPLVTLAFVWLAFLRPAERRRGNDWVLLICFAALTLAHVAYWHSGIMYGPRYLYAAVPALLLLTARGVLALAGMGQSGRLAAAVLVGALILGNLLFYLPGQVQAHRGYNLVSGREQAAVEAAAPDNALVFVEPGQGDWWSYGVFFSGNSPWLDGRIIYARDLGEENGRLMAVLGERPAFRWVDGVLLPLD